MNRIEPGDEGYDELKKQADYEGGVRVNFQGHEWMKIEDNGQIVFVRVGVQSGINDHYSSSSISHG